MVALIHALPEHLELPEHGLIGDVPSLSPLHRGVDLEQHAVQPPELVLRVFCLGPFVPLDRLGQGSVQEIAHDRGDDEVHCDNNLIQRGEVDDGTIETGARRRLMVMERIVSIVHCKDTLKSIVQG